MKLLACLAALALCASGQEADLAVVQKISGSVGFYTRDGKFLGAVKVGTHPHEAVLSPDKRLLYVTDNGILWMWEKGEGGNTISIVDVKNRQKVGVIGFGANRRPHGIDFDPKTGNLVATTENPSGLVLVDPAARKVLRTYDVKGEAPHMVLLDPKFEDCLCQQYQYRNPRRRKSGHRRGSDHCDRSRSAGRGVFA